MTSVRISAVVWGTYSDAEKSFVIDSLFDTWREKGFPHYILTEEERNKEFQKLAAFDTTNLIANNVVGQTLHALGLAWHYFPHHWSVRTGKMLTPVDVWENDDLLKKALFSRLKWGGYSITDGVPSITLASMRKAVRSYSGVQRVSNFRPSAAKAIYNFFPNVETVWDMSSGFGGRLFGFLSSNAKHYVGTDPAVETFRGLEAIGDEWAARLGKSVDLHNVGSEVFEPEAQVFDLCFTSPPYFSREKYSEDEGQSFKKFDSINDWNDGFLRQTFENCRQGLKADGVLAMNVANVKEHPNLVADVEKIAGQAEFEQLETMQYALSSISKGGLKYEPILVFRKK